MTMKKFLESYNKALDDLENLDEAIKKTVSRTKDGKVNVSYKSTRSGYRVKKIKGRPVEVRMSPIERRHRSEAAKKAAKKRKNKTKVKKSQTRVKKKKLRK